MNRWENWGFTRLFAGVTSEHPYFRKLKRKSEIKNGIDETPDKEEKAL